MNSTNCKTRIGVIGPGEADDRLLALAEEVGAEIARAGGVVVCGGLGGVMQAAARGAKQAAGMTVGILPGTSGDESNPFIDFPIVTGMGEGRNAVVVRTSQAVIAIGGAYGTLSEIALALKMGVPVIGLGTWELKAPDGSVPPILAVATAADAVEKAFRAARNKNRY